MMLHRTSGTSWRAYMLSPQLGAFFVIYSLLILYCRLAFYRDPTSLFFDPSMAYRREYSSTRQRQAERFIEGAVRASFRRPDNSTPPSLCVGIPTVARDGERYFQTSVGGLLHGLTEEERKDIHLITFIAHTEPRVHPAYSEDWLYNVADQILTYDLPPEQLERIREMERQKDVYREKGLYDFSYLLEACYRVGAANILMVEDDVLALNGWYHRTVKALDVAKAQTYRKGVSDCTFVYFACHLCMAELILRTDLYLRLFYTEELLGWNIEEWPTYLAWSFALAAGPMVAMIVARYQFKHLGRSLTDYTIILVCGMCIPLCIGLFFAAGRNSMLPIPAGVNEMPKFGCCSQSLVFPQSKVPKVLKWFADKKIGFVDTLTEELADQQNEIRWALTPSPMQHIGGKSSKSELPRQPNKMSVAEKLWNFAFELNDPELLRREHQEEITSWN